MIMKSKLTSVALLSSTALSGFAMPALALDDDDKVVEEITVTATRRATTVQEIPYNISAVSGDSVQERMMLDAPELLRSIPGIVVADRGFRNAATKNDIRIRGINVDGAARGDYAASSAPTVATYVNDTPLFSNMLLKDLERVEVLRGPQGTLYGSGALGGAVRYITKKPDTSEASGYMTGTISNTKGGDGEDSWTGDLVVNYPFSDKFAVRAVVSHIENAGIIDYQNVYVLDGDDNPVVPGAITDPSAEYESVKNADWVNIDYMRIAAFADISEKADLTLTYATQTDRTGGRRATAEGFARGFGGTYGRYSSGSVQTEPSMADMEMFSAELNVDLGFATLTSSTSMYDIHGNAISENTGFYAQKNWLAGFYYNSPRPLARADRRFSDEAFVQEARLVSNGDETLDWILGFYYQNQDKMIGQTSTLAGYGAWASTVFGWMFPGYGYDLNDNDFEFDDLTDVKETAVYGEITYDLSEDLHFTGGFRWFDSSVTSNASVRLPFWEVLFPAAVATGESGNKDTLFKGNISYDMNENTMLYATISEGYRRGGYASVPTAGAFAEDPAWLTYGSDTTVNYEIGIKGSNENMSYTVGLFMMDWKNPQINTATANWGFFTVANGDKARTKGFEVEMQGQATDQLSYSLGYAFVDAELTRDFISPTGFTIATTGNKLPGIPKHTFNAAVNYATALTDKIDMDLRFDMYSQSKTYNYINNSSADFGQVHDNFSIVNASATFSKDDLALTLYAKNLFNSDGVTATFSEGYMGTDPAQNYWGSGAKRVITQPFTMGMGLKYNF